MYTAPGHLTSSLGRRRLVGGMAVGVPPTKSIVERMLRAEKLPGEEPLTLSAPSSTISSPERPVRRSSTLVIRGNGQGEGRKRKEREEKEERKGREREKVAEEGEGRQRKRKKGVMKLTINHQSRNPIGSDRHICIPHVRVHRCMCHWRRCRHVQSRGCRSRAGDHPSAPVPGSHCSLVYRGVGHQRKLSGTPTGWRS